MLKAMTTLPILTPGAGSGSGALPTNCAATLVRYQLVPGVALRDIDCEALQSWIGRGRYHLDWRRQQVAVRGHNGHRYGIAVIVRQVEGPDACRAAVEKAEAILTSLHVEVGLDGAV